MNKKINPEIIDEMVEYYETHTSAETVAKFGIIRGLPQYYYVKKHGHKKPPERNRLTNKQSKQIAEFSRYNTINATMQKFGVKRAVVLNHFYKHIGGVHPCQVRSVLKKERGNYCRQNGALKRVHELSVGEWFSYFGQSYRVGAKTNTIFICNRYDYNVKEFNGKIELGIKNQMKVQTLILEKNY